MINDEYSPCYNCEGRIGCPCQQKQIYDSVCPDCGEEMHRNGRCKTCPDCGFSTCV